MQNKTADRPFLLTKDAGRNLKTMIEQARTALADVEDVEDAARILDDLKLQIKQIRQSRQSRQVPEAKT